MPLIRSQAWRSWAKHSISLRTVRCGVRNAPFSLYARHCTLDPARSSADSAIPNKQLQEKDTRHKSKKRKSGFAVPALAFSAVAIPLGWYLDSIYDTRSGLKVSHPREFIPYTLVGKDPVSSTCSIFRLRPASNVHLDLYDPSLERAITSVEFKQPQLQIARAYTCLPQVDGQPAEELRFLIRREVKGEVSNFLHRLPLDSKIEVRGLHPEYELPADVKNVIFLVGGTGIAPAMQAADLLERQANVHILWACRRREDCVGGGSDQGYVQKSSGWWPFSKSVTTNKNVQEIDHAEKGTLVKMLEGLKKQTASSSQTGSQLVVDCFVDDEGAYIRPLQVREAAKALSGADASRRILFVSGPEGFVNHWAGAKQWVDGREVQGPLGGALSTLDLRGWEVVKL